MKELQLTLNESSDYMLYGDIKELINSRRAKMLLRSNFIFTEFDDHILFKSGESLEKISSILQIAARYVNLVVKYDEIISSDIREFSKREEDFVNFSTKAQDIKNNRCDIIDFSDFTEVLKNTMKTRTLYPLQLLSSYHLAFYQNACNFSVPGAGKTSIVYGAYSYLKSLNAHNSKKVDKILIIGPLSSFRPWELEYEECFGVVPSSKRISADLNLESKKQYFYGDTAELILLSYASVVSLKDSLKYFLSNNSAMVVLDEAHKIKNTNGGITANTILELAQLCTSRVVLTGTPVPNGYEDLFNLLNYVWPRKNVVNYTVGQLRNMNLNASDVRIQKLMDNIDPYYIRIKKSDLGIPSPIENPPYFVQMKESQRRIYDFIEEQFIKGVDKFTQDIHSTLLRARMIRLQQVATNPAMLRIPLAEFSDIENIDFSGISDEENIIMKDVVSYISEEVPAKYEKCAEIIRDIISKKGKVIIWAVFIDTIKSFSKYLFSLGINNKILYGNTPIANEGMESDENHYELTREGIIRDFHNVDSDFNVIIANPFAVAESISLHKACHNAIYLERTFNCAHFVQSKDRIHRFGIDPEVDTNYFYLLSENSIDETINSRLMLKEKRMTSLLEANSIPLFDNIGEEGNEDIKAIISDYVKRKNRKE